ncbi:hypothetical protein BS47DRAFT_1388906 [Hydnum rufescens UP504]|uniref:Major facilitator superfamily (MFS) profile domain-containing protein n=1 Tax=Hydnum rufescens UP504 TaxID=1448309 RepID=A0A9P6DYI4_9AGAM|nr:hypothetical protein BS47DRAFT_1388906 [Hydnum rufescens UP504]
MAAHNSDAERTPLVKTIPTPFPWRPASTLFFLTLIQPLAFELIFPFINQMLLDLEIVGDPESVGFHSGIIVRPSSSFIELIQRSIDGNLPSLHPAIDFQLDEFPRDYASDHIGRKPVILWSTVGVAMSIVSFGLSRTFSGLILSRCLGGALGGAVTAIRTMGGELTDRSNQSMMFSGMSITYRTGQIAGLALGGLLVHPQRRFPRTIFGDPFWGEYPFVLPCFVGGAFALSAAIFGAFFLQETLPSKMTHETKTTSSDTSRDAFHPCGLRDDTARYGATNRSDDQLPSPSTSAKCDHQSPAEEQFPSLRSVLTKGVVSLMVSNFIMCFSSELMFSVFTLFAFTPIKSGGLGFSEAQIGARMSLRGVMGVATMLLFTPIHKFIGRSSAVRLHQYAMAIWPLSVLPFPLLNLLARREGGPSGWLFELTFFCFVLLWCFAGFTRTCIFMMTADASPTASGLARINGMIQMSSLLPQAIAPAFGTSLFAFSIKSGIANGYLLYIFFFIFTSVGAVHSLTLTEPTTDWREGTQKASEDLE